MPTTLSPMADRLRIESLRSADRVMLRIAWSRAGFRRTGELDSPLGTMRLRDIAGFAMRLSSLLVGWAESLAVERGDKISCSKGCSACCSQPVPLSPAEAIFLGDWLASAPRDAKEFFQGGFGRNLAAIAALEAEGLSQFHHAETFFDLGLPCPFLQAGACGIHPHRPVVCREHLVVSPAIHCGSLANPSIAVMPLAVSVREALSLLCAELLDTAPVAIPLLGALAWAEGNPGLSEREWRSDFVLDRLAFHLTP